MFSLPGELLGAGGGLLALLLGIWYAYQRGKSSARTEQKAKEADAYAKHLEEIGEANRAGQRVSPSDSLHNDPYNRDKKRSV